MYTWESLAELTLRRQFPESAGVVDLVARIGPVQSQTARALFLCAAARRPGTTHAEVTAAYESFDLVRGSNLRGTVHTCLRSDHPVLDAVSRRALDKQYRSWLRLTQITPADVQAALEEFAAADWRTQAELRDFLGSWLPTHDPGAVTVAGGTPGGAVAHVHGCLLRRPSRGGWDQQTTPVYRAAAVVLADRRPLDPHDALVSLAHTHLRSFGPATRHDIAWWTGARLSDVDAALTALEPSLTSAPGPDGHTYWDVADVPVGGNPDVGLRLAPEYDALFLGYAPAGRWRFGSTAALEHLNRSKNGVYDPLVLVDGRLRASWRLTKEKAGAVISISPLPGERAVQADEVADQADAVGAALNLKITEIRC